MQSLSYTSTFAACKISHILATDSHSSSTVRLLRDTDAAERAANDGFSRGAWQQEANWPMQQLRELLSFALREFHANRLFKDIVRSALAASCQLSGESDSEQIVICLAVSDLNSEPDTITAMDAQMANPVVPSAASPKHLQALMTNRLFGLLFPDTCAWLLTNFKLAELLCQCLKAALPILLRAVDAANGADGDTLWSFCSIPIQKSQSNSIDQRHRCRRHRSQHIHSHRQKYGCDPKDYRKIRSASCATSLNSSTMVLQSEDRRKMQLELVLSTAPTALSSEDSNSYQPQPQLQVRVSSKHSTRCPNRLDHLRHCEGSLYKHRRLIRQQRLQSDHHCEPPQQLVQTQSPLLPSLFGAKQPLCSLHSTANGFRTSPTSSPSSSCPVCASRHFLLRHLANLVGCGGAKQRQSTDDLVQLVKTLSKCLEQQSHWQRSLKWIASNVKERRLPRSVRSVISSCWYTADKSSRFKQS